MAEDASYAQAVRWAAEQGIIKGMDGKFVADGILTREQLAAMLYRNTDGTDAGDDNVLASFSDGNEVSPWAQDAMAWAVEHHLINGRTGGILAPQDAVTRAELAVILQRYADVLGVSTAGEGEPAA